MSGDEVISSSYDLIEKDDVVYEVDCQMITKGGESYSNKKRAIPDSNLTHPTDTGANASAEEAEEGVEDGALQVNNVVDAFRLQKVEGVYNTIKDYQAQFKGEEAHIKAKRVQRC